MDQAARSGTFTTARAVVLMALGLLAARTLEIVLFAYRHSFFIGDDVAEFWQARTLGLRELLLTPVDVHLVPLHRLVALVVWNLSPMNYGLALLVLGALHVTALVALWKILREFQPAPLAAVLLAAYGLNAGLPGLFLWWMAGLHRLGCVCFSALAVLSYLRFRASGARSWAALFAGCTLASLGFYSKGALVLPNVFLLELLLVGTPCAASVRSRSTVLAVTLVLVLAYLAVWRSIVGPDMAALRFDLPFHGRFVTGGIRRYLEYAVGVWESALSPWGEIFTALSWSSVIVVAWRSSRRARWALAAVFASLAGSLLAISLSAAKTRLFGDATVLPDRYYFEPGVFVVVFLALALRDVGPRAPGATEDTAGRPEAPISRRRALSTWVVLAGLVAGNVCSVTSERALLRYTGYSLHETMRAFVHTLRASVAALPPGDRDPISLTDTPSPAFVMPAGPLVRRSSEVLLLLGEKVRTSRDGKYVVTPSGELRRAPRRSRRHRR